MTCRKIRRHFVGGILAACSLLLGGTAFSDVPSEVEYLGRSETLSQPYSPYWIWASDAILEKMALIDLESGAKLGEVDGGIYISTGLFPDDDEHFYLPETHYSLGSRGERSDVITFYDSQNLAITDTVYLPTQRAHNALPTGNSAISDNGRFLAVYNFTPAQSISIVDTQSRQFTGEIQTPGCSLVYGAGDDRFFMFCSDGSLLFISLGSDGRPKEKWRSERFFNPLQDPLTEKGVRVNDDWYFVSFEGHLYRIDVSGQPRFAQPVSVLSEEDRSESWRVGGRQFLAIDESSQRAFVLVHQGDIDTHKTGGTHMVVFDLKQNAPLQRIALQSPGLTFSGQSMEFGSDWIWPFNQLYNLITRTAMRVEPQARPDTLLVTGGDKPLLVIAGEFTGSLALYDTQSLEFLRRVNTFNWTTLAIQNPHWGDSKGIAP